MKMFGTDEQNDGRLDNKKKRYNITSEINKFTRHF